MRIAVTGGMGFIGTEIVKRALAEGNEVICVDFLEDLIPDYERNKYPILDDVYANLAGCARVVYPWDLVHDFEVYAPQVIIHAGAVVDTTDMGSEILFARNLSYTGHLCRKASEMGAHMVFSSSASVYGNGQRRHPINPYALTKALGERLLEGMKTRTVALRYFNVFGKNEHHKGEMASVPFKISQAYAKGEQFSLFRPESARDFVPVSTVAQVTLEVAVNLLGPATPNGHKIFDVGTGEATTFNDLDNFIMQAMGKKQSIVKEIPMPKSLEGRYQMYTCAGGPRSPGLLAIPKTTRDGLEEMYGKD